MRGEKPGSQEARRGAKAYQGVFEAVFSILIGAGLGALADSQFGTNPRYLLVGLALGMGAFILRIVRLVRELDPARWPADENAGESSEDRERKT